MMKLTAKGLHFRDSPAANSDCYRTTISAAVMAELVKMTLKIPKGLVHGSISRNPKTRLCDLFHSSQPALSADSKDDVGFPGRDFRCAGNAL